MDGLVIELLRLERAKHQALVSIDATAYDASVREQLRLISSTNGIGKVKQVERLLALSRLINQNTRLLQNLLSTTPAFNAAGCGYSATGQPSSTSRTALVSVEA